MKKTLVIGASLNPARYSNIAINRLVAHNIDTEAFGLKKGTVAGVEIKEELKGFTGIHTISLYLNAQRQPQYYDKILEIKPQRVLFNPGTENPEFYPLLKAANIEFEEACTLVLLATSQY